MAPTYVLNYFPIAGRAEIARLMFHVAGVEFTDNQFSMADWPKHKSDVTRFPLGQLPTLQVDDNVVCQSRAINCYLAEEFGLHGTSNTDRVFGNQIVETVVDLQDGFAKIRFDRSKDEDTKKSEIQAYFATERCKQLLSFINSKVKTNPGSFFLGEKVSYVDLVYFVAHEYLAASDAPLASYPELLELYEKIAGLEPISKYLASRKHGLFF